MIYWLNRLFDLPLNQQDDNDNDNSYGNESGNYSYGNHPALYAARSDRLSGNADCGGSTGTRRCRQCRR